MGIFEQLNKENVVEYNPSKFTIEEFIKTMSEIFNREDSIKSIRVQTGLISGFLLDLAIQIKVPYSVETYERIYGLVQISLYSKHSLNKIVVNLLSSDETPFKVIHGTTIIAKTASLKEALKYSNGLSSYR